VWHDVCKSKAKVIKYDWHAILSTFNIFLDFKEFATDQQMIVNVCACVCVCVRVCVQGMFPVELVREKDSECVWEREGEKERIKVCV